MGDRAEARRAREAAGVDQDPQRGDAVLDDAVADLWTNKIDELEYTIFLNKIFHRITRWNRHAELRGVAAPRVTGDSSSEPPKKVIAQAGIRRIERRARR